MAINATLEEELARIDKKSREAQMYRENISVALQICSVNKDLSAGVLRLDVSGFIQRNLAALEKLV